MGKRGPPPGRLRRILTGVVSGRLRCVGFNGMRVVGQKWKKTESFWRCHCAPDLGGCGAYTVVSRANLVSKRTRSCRCLARDLNRARWNVFKAAVRAAETRIDSGNKVSVGRHYPGI